MLLSLITAAVMATSPASGWKVGADISTGDDLYQACSDRTDEQRELACVYYFRGATAMATLDKKAEYDRYKISGTQRLGFICPAGGTTTFDLIDVINVAVAKTPALKEIPAPDVLVSALTAAFPCSGRP